MAPARFSITHTADNSMKKVICGERNGTDCQFQRLQWYIKPTNKQKTVGCIVHLIKQALQKDSTYRVPTYFGQQKSMNFYIFWKL